MSEYGELSPEEKVQKLEAVVAAQGRELKSAGRKSCMTSCAGIMICTGAIIFAWIDGAAKSFEITTEKYKRSIAELDNTYKQSRVELDNTYKRSVADIGNMHRKELDEIEATYQPRLDRRDATIAALDSQVECMTRAQDEYIASVGSEIAEIKSATGLARKERELNNAYKLLQHAYEDIAAIHSNCNHPECDQLRSDLEQTNANLQDRLREYKAERKARRRAERTEPEQR